MKIKHLVVVWLVGILAACSSRPDGSEYVGKWQQTKVKNGFTFEFVKNGDTLLLVASDGTFPAIVNKDSTLQVSMPLLGNAIVTYSKDSDTIFMMGDEFRRVK